MAKTLANLRLDILAELGEEGNSQLAAVPSGTSDSTTVTATANTNRLINEAAMEICRTALLLPATGTLDIDAGSNGWQLSAFTVSGMSLWRIADLRLGSSDLQWIGSEQARSYYPSAATATAGIPRYWFWPDGDKARVMLNKPVSVPSALTATAFGLYAPISSDGASFDWLGSDDDADRALVLYAAAKLARKGSDEVNTAGRFTALAAEYDAIRARLRSRLSGNLSAILLDPLIPLAVSAATMEG